MNIFFPILLEYKKCLEIYSSRQRARLRWLKMGFLNKVFPGSRNLAPDSCAVIATITTQESGARLREPGKTLVP